MVFQRATSVYVNHFQRFQIGHLTSSASPVKLGDSDNDLHPLKTNLLSKSLSPAKQSWCWKNQALVDCCTNLVAFSFMEWWNYYCSQLHHVVSLLVCFTTETLLGTIDCFSSVAFIEHSACEWVTNLVIKSSRHLNTVCFRIKKI